MFNNSSSYQYYHHLLTLRRNGVTIIVNKRIQNAVLGYNLKNDRMISVCFQGKPFNITIIQVYALTIDWRSWSWAVLWRHTRPSSLTPKKDVLFITGDWNVKVGSQTVLWTLWERERVGRFGRTALKHVKYHVWNELPVQVRCTILDAWG